MGRTGRRDTGGGHWLLRLALGVLLLLAVQGVQCEHEPTESECRPYIEKALKEHHVEPDQPNEDGELDTDASSIEQKENSSIDEAVDSNEEQQDDNSSLGGTTEDNGTAEESSIEGGNAKDAEEDLETNSDAVEILEETPEGEDENKTDDQNDTGEQSTDEGSLEGNIKEVDEEGIEEKGTTEVEQETNSGEEADQTEGEGSEEGDVEEAEVSSQEETIEAEGDTHESQTEADANTAEEENDKSSHEDSQVTEEETDGDLAKKEDSQDDNSEGEEDTKKSEDKPDKEQENASESIEEEKEGTDSGQGLDEVISQSVETVTEGNTTEETAEQEDEKQTTESQKTETQEGSQEASETIDEYTETKEGTADSEEDSQQDVPEEDLTKEITIPQNLRPRDHITQILKLDEAFVETESALAKTVETTLKTLKNLYDTAIKPLEILYKYRDLSNRHFGDPEIFSKPLILFMGPWSGGKSSTINYLLNLEFSELALRTGAEPSPAYFNILTYGEEIEVLDGTQLAADWTFSGLQKFGQGLLDRLRGVKLPNRLLEKVNIVEIPGILEIRKQVQRLFPFNDACQWFIDRADIIFLVYDPAKLDVGPETEAILDQLKGREYQTRIILNKADQVKPEELMRVQGTLIWNISPLMSSQEPPVMYTTSLWSLPYEASAPARLLLAQERAFLRDLREAIDKRVENKVASARRFAVRVRNHAKMVDCYLTTYYNHKTFFGNRKKISDDIIENPQKYHIYEGLSTLTNISRYDLPDPEMYRDFFRINPLYEFTKLSDTCTYFRGCPINKLDVAIAYDLPELVGKYKKAVEAAKTNS